MQQLAYNISVKVLKYKEKDKVKEILEMLETQRKNKIDVIESEDEE